MRASSGIALPEMGGKASGVFFCVWVTGFVGSGRDMGEYASVNGLVCISSWTLSIEMSSMTSQAPSPLRGYLGRGSRPGSYTRRKNLGTALEGCRIGSCENLPRLALLVHCCTQRDFAQSVHTHPLLPSPRASTLSSDILFHVLGFRKSRRDTSEANKNGCSLPPPSLPARSRHLYSPSCIWDTPAPHALE